VTTVEGCGQDGALHAVQQRSLTRRRRRRLLHLGDDRRRGRADAVNPEPDEQRSAPRSTRNLCRCGTHVRVVAAVLRAADTHTSSRATAIMSSAHNETSRPAPRTGGTPSGDPPQSASQTTRLAATTVLSSGWRSPPRQGSRSAGARGIRPGVWTAMAQVAPGARSGRWPGGTVAPVSGTSRTRGVTSGQPVSRTPVRRAARGGGSCAQGPER